MNSYAVFYNNREGLSELLAKGANVYAQDSLGMTPLMHAVAQGKFDMVKDFLASGANPQIPDKSNRNALTIAAETGNFHIYYLLEKNLREASAKYSAPLPVPFLEEEQKKVMEYEKESKKKKSTM